MIIFRYPKLLYKQCKSIATTRPKLLVFEITINALGVCFLYSFQICHSLINLQYYCLLSEDVVLTWF